VLGALHDVLEGGRVICRRTWSSSAAGATMCISTSRFGTFTTESVIRRIPL
jgi:hypothetical protein